MSGERSAATLIAIRGAGSSPPVRRLSPPSCRCRPADVPRWVRLDLSAAEAAALRDAVAEAEVSLDMWLAVMVEFSASLGVLGEVLGSFERACAQLSGAIEGQPVKVAALPDWREWQTSLMHHRPADSDELPEVVLPQRLLARSGGSIDVAAVLAAAPEWLLARACELAACGRGQTLEAFALETCLADMASACN